MALAEEVLGSAEEPVGSERDLGSAGPEWLALAEKVLGSGASEEHGTAEEPVGSEWLALGGKVLGSADSEEEFGSADSDEELGSADSEEELGSADSDEELGSADSEEELGSAHSGDFGYAACHQPFPQTLTVERCPLQHLDPPLTLDKLLTN